MDNIQKPPWQIPESNFYRIENNRLVNENGDLSNCLFEVTAYRVHISGKISQDDVFQKNYLDESIDKNYFVDLEFFRRDFDNSRAKVTISLDDIDDCKILKHIPGEFRFFQYTGKNLEKFIGSIINNIIGDKKPEIYARAAPGLHFDGSGNPFFVLADRVINKPPGVKIIADSNYTLRLGDPDDNGVDFIKETLLNGYIPPVMFIAVIAQCLQPMLHSLDININRILYLYSKTSTGKTTLAKQFCNIFENIDNLKSFASDKEALRAISDPQNFITLVDDLNNTDSNVTKNNNEEKLSMIVRQIDSGGIVEYKGKNVTISNLVVITGEYLPNTPSALSRCILLNLDNCFDPRQIDEFIANQKLYVNFLVTFLEKIYGNYSFYLKGISKIANEFDKKFLKGKDGLSGVNRIAATNKLLYITTYILLTFLGRYLGFYDDDINKIYKNCKLSIDSCITHTLDLVNKAHTDPDYEIVEEITKRISADMGVQITDSFKKYSRAISQSKLFLEKGLPEYYGYMDKYSVYIRGEYLCMLTSKKLSDKAISKILKKYNVIVVTPHSTTTRIPGKRKKDNGRYYCFHIDRINEIVHAMIDRSN